MKMNVVHEAMTDILELLDGCGSLVFGVGRSVDKIVFVFLI